MNNDTTRINTASTPFLSNLNPIQLQAVKQDPKIPVQILAGPGSGKTKVLTSRIAYLILARSMPPSSICAVTFTNKAANEIRERLTKLIGKQRSQEVRMGTFHALCAMFLRKYGNLVGLKDNFTICDADESKKIISTLLKAYEDILEQKVIVLKEGTVLSMISKAKAKRLTAAEFLTRLRIKAQEKKPNTTHVPPNDIEHVVAEIYEQYERSLHHNNSLDFDDLLLNGVKLFTQHKHTVAWCKHVLVDEFQDTNYAQYDLMTALAVDNCVTIVGDPDQSIYGWRSAEVQNLAKMCKDFNGTKQIFLEQNYRSTAAILKTSLAIIAQDKSRIQKSLYTSHPAGPTPVLRFFPDEHAEATFIASEIKRMVAQMGGVLKWGDFVVLLRFNALSRTIESALQKEGIPNKILGGHKFFERLEIKNLLAYLQLVDNPSFDPAFVRAVNVPSRGIGEKTLLEIASRAAKSNESQLHITESVCDGRSSDIKPAIKRKLTPFVATIRTLRDLANDGTSPADLIRRLLELVEFEEHLRKTQLDWESRWENVQELITFASEAEAGVIDVGSPSAEKSPSLGIKKDTPLRLFLQASMLSPGGSNEDGKDGREKVTISTCHAAKGLEWPVVMIPAVEQGTFPFYRAEDTEEERRLLYVACTRAQGLLYLSFVGERKVAGNTKEKQLSSFVSAMAKDHVGLFKSWQPNLLPADREIICNILDRRTPDEQEISRRMAEFHRTTRHPINGEFQPSWHVVESINPDRPQAKDDANSSSDNIQLNKDLMTVLVRRPHNRPSYTTLPDVSTASISEAIHVNENILLRQDQTPTSSLPNPSKAVLRNQPSRQSSPGPASATNVACQGTKRRLGMGRGAVGYTNKKFKLPT